MVYAFAHAHQATILLTIFNIYFHVGLDPLPAKRKNAQYMLIRKRLFLLRQAHCNCVYILHSDRAVELGLFLKSREAL